MRIPFYIKYLFLLFVILSGFKLPSQNLQMVDSLQNLLKSTKSDTTKISVLMSLSDYYHRIQLNKSFEYGREALALSIKLNHSPKIAYAYFRMADLYLNKGDYGSATENCFKALKIYEELKDNASMVKCYNTIGQIYYHQKNYNEALSYYYKSLKISKESGRKNDMCRNYNDIGIIYTIQKKYDEAINSYTMVLKIAEDIGNKEAVAASYANISMIYYYDGKLNLAIENTEKAIKIDEEIGDKKSLLGSYSNLGAMYLGAEKYEEAAIPLQKALKYVNEINDKSFKKDLFENFSILYSKQNDFRKAFEYSQLISALKDSIYNESNIRQANEMTTKYESEKKELMINSLEKEKENEKKFRIFLIIFCMMIAVFAFVLFRGNVQKRKVNLDLSRANQEIRLKNKDITDSINYSKRIQDASLTPKELKYKLFKDAFVLFKPKDIVSGDFYWFAEKNGKRLIASCDCTGHGVPGALMSMIGNNILNQIVNEKGITSPEEVLNHLHKEVRKALKQEEQSTSQDGMDIAFITFNSETEIEYAGAQRPLWIVRSPESSVLGLEKNTLNHEQQKINNELIEIKADKFSIGGNQSETERRFCKHRISLTKGDCIYIFSDGFVDQFGGTERKKFMNKRFKNLLLDNFTKAMPEQETILETTIETWRGASEQVDDILVIGIRI